MNRGPVILPLSIARCPATRTGPCSRDGTCARAFVDGKGRAVHDYSDDARAGDGSCMSYMAAGPRRQAAGEKLGRMHEAPAGIFRV